MTSLNDRINILDKLGKYMLSDDADWMQTKKHAENDNGWFTPEFIDKSINNIVTEFLNKEKLHKWVEQYNIKEGNKTIGIITAGNIPLVGFHDFLCGFISGYKVRLKLSSKDKILLSHIVDKLQKWSPELTEYIEIADMLKDCDAYIATGSNNSSRYFEQYFSKYPNIIRKNRTSVAILDGAETNEDIYNLGIDIYSYFGLGCRNVTKVYLPEKYDIQTLISGLEPYTHFKNHHKYRNNYDYHLAIYLLNKVKFHTDETLILIENKLPFSAVSVIHYEYYKDKQQLLNSLQNDDHIQCVVGHGCIPFGNAQTPSLTDYADGVDTMAFLCGL